MAHGADTPAPAAAAGPRELPVFILTGPTGAGKTDWALGLAESAPVEIVSVDSALVYRGLDIGTAKPARELRARVPHHLIDICEPTEGYSAGRFVADYLRLLRQYTHQHFSSLGHPDSARRPCVQNPYFQRMQPLGHRPDRA